MRIQSGRFGSQRQCDEDKDEHYQPVKDALHDDRCQAGAHGDVFALVQHIGTKQLSGPETVDVVAHIADDDHRKEPAYADLLEWAGAYNPSARCAPKRRRNRPPRWGSATNSCRVCSASQTSFNFKPRSASHRKKALISMPSQSCQRFKETFLSSFRLSCLAAHFCQHLGNPVTHTLDTQECKQRRNCIITPLPCLQSGDLPL